MKKFMREQNLQKTICSNIRHDFTLQGRILEEKNFSFKHKNISIVGVHKMFLEKK